MLTIRSQPKPSTCSLRREYSDTPLHNYQSLIKSTLIPAKRGYTPHPAFNVAPGGDGRFQAGVPDCTLPDARLLLGVITEICGPGVKWRMTWRGGDIQQSPGPGNSATFLP